FQIRNIPKEWQRIFQASGVTKSDLRNPETALFIFNTISDTLSAPTSREPPPPPPPVGAALPPVGAALPPVGIVPPTVRAPPLTSTGPPLPSRPSGSSADFLPPPLPGRD